MPIAIPHYDVTVADPGVELEVAAETGAYTEYKHVPILHTDQIVAEQAGARYGLGELRQSPLGYSTLWVWCALRRRGDLDVSAEANAFPAWKQRVLLLAQDKDEQDHDDQARGTPVDPTTPGVG